MKTQIQITAKQLELIIEEAKERMKKNTSLSDTLIITVNQPCSTHCGSDVVTVEQNCVYSECVSILIYQNN